VWVCGLCLRDSTGVTRRLDLGPAIDAARLVSGTSSEADRDYPRRILGPAGCPPGLARRPWQLKRVWPLQPVLGSDTASSACSGES
jgi:hypothetical protein